MSLQGLTIQNETTELCHRRSKRCWRAIGVFMNIVFIGAPGTGKGTIASRLKEHGFTHIAPGDLFRKEAKKGTALGKEVKGRIEKGILIPDETTTALVKRYTSKNNIFDGYPRTLPQAEALDSFAKPDMVLFFDMSEQDIVERLSGRRTCPDCHAIYHTKNIPPKKAGICDNCSTKLVQRKDDMPDVTRHRFHVFQKQTAPLIELYTKRKLLKKIDASGTPDEVYVSVKALLRLK